MGSRLVAPHPLIPAPPRAKPKTKFQTSKPPTIDDDAEERCPMTAIAGMMRNGFGALNGGAPVPPPAETLREAWLPAEAASGAAARAMVSEAAADAGLDGGRTWDLMLATSEAFANAVQHGKPWPNECILLRAERCVHGVRVEVTDCGSFDSQLAPAGLDDTSGRGIQIIAAIVDRLEVQNGNGRTLVRFEKHTNGA
jgi:serine/threonine-protein kinase RsbW